MAGVREEVEKVREDLLELKEDIDIDLNDIHKRFNGLEEYMDREFAKLREFIKEQYKYPRPIRTYAGPAEPFYGYTLGDKVNNPVKAD